MFTGKLPHVEFDRSDPKMLVIYLVVIFSPIRKGHHCVLP